MFWPIDTFFIDQSLLRNSVACLCISSLELAIKSIMFMELQSSHAPFPSNEPKLLCPVGEELRNNS